jgi:two-component system, cell cycle sensor histidine kinase and response regulator CckA
MTTGDYVCMTVSDTGNGMSLEVQTHLFEPFFTTKEQGKGTGLGLATCYGIIRRHGGAIRVDSALGQGTTISIYLPQVVATGTPAAYTPADGLPRGTETILLVEDEPAVRVLAARVLREQGYRVLEAGHGAEALQVALNYGLANIGLLLTDVVMPQMGGVALAEQLADLRPDIKVLFMSGYTDNVQVQHDRLVQGEFFLQKPFPPGVLVRKVREVLDAA